MMAIIAATALTLGSFTTRHYDEYVPKDHYVNVNYRIEMMTLAGQDASAAAQMRTLCSEDPLFYINTFCNTYSPKDSISGYPLTPFVTYEFQNEAVLELLDCVNKGQDAATPKSRDMGASWMGLTAIEWCWHFRDYLSFLMVSRKEDLVDKKGFPGSLFWKIDFLHQYQPHWLLPEGRWMGPKDPHRKALHLTNADNGSVIDGESTTGNVGVGDRRTALFIDEFGAFPVDDGYAVLRGTRDVTNCRLFNSTPRGQNAFYEVCTKTAARIIRLHWSRHPLKSVGMYETDAGTGEVMLKDDHRGMVDVIDKGEAVPRQVMFPDDYPFVKDGKLRSPWYDLQCNRCVSLAEIAQELDIDFLGSDYQFFDAESIEALRKKYCRPVLLVGDLEYDPVTLEIKRFNEHKDGRLSLWVTLDGNGRLPRDRKFVIGSDVSAGTGASNSVSCVVDKETGEKVGVWRDSHSLPNPFAELTMAMAKWANNAFMVWDASGPTGKNFTDRVVKHGYGNIYYRRNEKKIGRQITDEPGYFLNPQAKTAVFEDYRDALGNHRYINRSETGMNECLQFIRKPDGSIEHSASANSQDPSGARTAHGDECVADALACLGMEERQENREPEEPEIPVGSLAWRQQQKRIAEQDAMVDALGKEWG